MYGRFEYYGVPDIDREMTEARQYTHIFQVPQDNRKEMQRFLKQKQDELEALEKRVAGAKEAIRMRAKELRRRPEDWQLTNRKLRDEYERVQLAIQMAQSSLSRMKEGAGLGIRQELELQEARRRYPAATYGGGYAAQQRAGREAGKDPKAGAGEFYRLRTQESENYFYRTGTLKNGNAKGFSVESYMGHKPYKAKHDSIYRPTLGAEWKKIDEKDVPPAVMARFKSVMESVELDEFRLFGRAQGDLRGVKKGQIIVYKSSTPRGGVGSEKKLTVAGMAKAKGYGKIVLAKDSSGKTYHLPLNSKGQATVVLRKTGDPDDPNESVGALHMRPVAWISEGLDEACGKKHGKKKSRKEEIDVEIGRLEATGSPFPGIRERRIEELRAELEEAKDIKGAQGYIRRIKNSGKKKYAEAWLKHCQGKGEWPSNKDFGISFMAAQAVRMNLEDFGFDSPEIE